MFLEFLIELLISDKLSMLTSPQTFDNHNQKNCLPPGERVEKGPWGVWAWLSWADEGPNRASAAGLDRHHVLKVPSEQSLE